MSNCSESENLIFFFLGSNSFSLPVHLTKIPTDIGCGDDKIHPDAVSIDGRPSSQDLFKENYPIATISKFIKLSVKNTGISLTTDGGTIMIDNFTDISFKYEWIK